MILRRVMLHVRKQEWTAIWIDLVIVVVGVFIGIQVANWNEQRTIDRKAEIFTERLRADLRIEAWNFEYLIGYYGEVLSNAERASAALEGRSDASDEHLLIAAYRATQFITDTQRRATYDEMRSTGALGLIKDQQLHEAATLVYASGFIDITGNQALGSRYREAFRMRVPVNVQSALGEQCGDRFVPIGDFAQLTGSLEYPCSIGLAQDVIDTAANALRTDETIVPLLRLRIADVKTVIGNQATSNQDARQALQAVVNANPRP